MAKTKTIAYQFTFQNGTQREYSVNLELPSHKLIAAGRTEQPAWTELQFHQCPNCPLKEDECPQCPVAVNLLPVIEAFNDCRSHEEVETTVRTEARDFNKRGPLQVGLSSLVGLVMATSGCPVLDKLRPMVYTHLPFSNAKETLFRAMAIYLLGQCVRQRQGRRPDWELKQLARTYDEIRAVNKAFAKRIRSMCAKDAAINAMVILDTFAGIASFALAKQSWKELESLFAPCPGEHSQILAESSLDG